MIDDTQPIKVKVRSPKKHWIGWTIFAIVVILGMYLLGAYRGYKTALITLNNQEMIQVMQGLQEQFQLGVEDFNDGNFELARKRFEYVLERDPSFSDASEKLTETLRKIYATATPTPVPPTPTLTPTVDMRPIEEKFTNAASLFANGDWNGVIDAIIALRRVDRYYRVVEVDRMIYLALRNRGIEKIKNERNLEGGMYDLSLAEQIGPLDTDALTYRNLARLYVIGSSFWLVFPEQAVYYFGQVASAAPYLMDASGWTARERYRLSLLHYADQLAKGGSWCAAQEQYILALAMGSNEQLQATATQISYNCATPTPTPMTVTPTPTYTQTLTYTPLPYGTPTMMGTLPATMTPTLGTPEPTVEQTPTPTFTLQPEMSPTIAFTSTPAATIAISTPIITKLPAPPLIPEMEFNIPFTPTPLLSPSGATYE